MMINPNTNESRSDTTDTTDDSDSETSDSSKKVLTHSEAMTHPSGRAKTSGYGAVEGKCNLGAGAVRW